MNAYSGLDDHLNLFVSTISEIGQRPHGVHEDVRIGVVDEKRQGRKQCPHNLVHTYDTIMLFENSFSQAHNL